jgi:hypothetical protein
MGSIPIPGSNGKRSEVRGKRCEELKELKNEPPSLKLRRLTFFAKASVVKEMKIL